MYSTWSFALAGIAALFVVVPASMAQQLSGEALAKASSCLACHQIDKKRVGPPFTAIAQRFATSEGAQAYLADTIRNGSRGRWGAVPMPAQPQVSAADAQLLAAWVLSLTSPDTKQAKQ
ncbi:c-type cytochrome [Pusillimonas sp. ANT_WB101]|uniref:c-type cytochrome n=1 Tax=Pusillimonas sp. ANT_WB101 TaxID=2597356 RepID=UPI0011EE974F|nr:c-type cytochrome [Pusillimonas sp. ANT_WB101]